MILLRCHNIRASYRQGELNVVNLKKRFFIYWIIKLN